jgi:hypothetical protein
MEKDNGFAFREVDNGWVAREGWGGLSIDGGTANITGEFSGITTETI